MSGQTFQIRVPWDESLRCRVGVEGVAVLDQEFILVRLERQGDQAVLTWQGPA